MYVILIGIVLLVVVATIAQGVVWLVVNFWWLLLALLVGGGIWMYSRPVVRASRRARAAYKLGSRMSDDITSATADAKRRMSQIAEEWNR